MKNNPSFIFLSKMVLISLKTKAKSAGKKIKNFFSKLGDDVKKKFSFPKDEVAVIHEEGLEEVRKISKEIGELAEQVNLWIDEAIVQEYKDTGGIPIRAGKYTKTFLKWYDNNY